MTRLLAALAIAIAVLAGRPASAEPADAAIEAVIADQLAAFQRDDFAAAFDHAHPVIRRKFGTPENFGRMVQQGYPMIWRPSRVEYGPLEPEADGNLVKTVVFEDGSGVLFEADYEMSTVDGEWRIRGVSLRRLPGLAS